MRRQDAENIIEEYLKPIFGFALKRCKSVQDAEDLSQDIVLRAFRALLAKDDIDTEIEKGWGILRFFMASSQRKEIFEHFCDTLACHSERSPARTPPTLRLVLLRSSTPRAGGAFRSG